MFNTYLSNFFMGNPFLKEEEEEEEAIIHEIDNQNHNIIPFHHPKLSSSTRKVSLTASKYSSKRNTYITKESTAELMQE
jgi:hypothetical protein